MRSCPLLWHSVLLHQCWTIAEISPRIRNVVMSRYGDKSVISRTAGTAILWLQARRVDALDSQFDEFEFVIEALTAYSNNRVQGYFHVGQFIRGFVEKVTDYTAQYGLMRDHKYVVGLLKIDNYRLDSLHRVHVAFAPWITIAQLILIAPSEFLEKKK